MRRVADGQPFSMSAEEFNSHQSAAAFVAAQQVHRGLPPSGPLHEIDRTRPWVVNESEESIRAFSCVKITGVAATHDVAGSNFYNKTPLKINKPTGEDDSFLILQDGLPSQNMATRAASDGITPAWVTFETGDEDAETAGPAADSFDLKAGGAGAAIIWKPDGTGSLLCVVRLKIASTPSGGGSMHVAVLDEDLYAGTSAKATLLYNGTPTDAKVTVHDDIMPNDTMIPKNAVIYIADFADCKFRVTGVSCDVLGDGNCGTGFLEEDPPVEET